MVPVHTVAILGTTDIKVADPDDYEITREEVVRLVDEGAKLFPDLPPDADPARLCGRPAAVQPPDRGRGAAATARSPARTRSSTTPTHGVDNFVSIVGGKLTTYRLMAEETVDVVAAKLGVTRARARRPRRSLPDQHGGKTYWLGHRLADHEEEGGGDADLLCECELVTRAMVDAYLDRHWPCSLDDVRRGTRVGMGPCQGAFCTFRVAGLVAERLDAHTATTGSPAPGTHDADGHRPGSGAAHAAVADRALTAFLRERFKGTRPIAQGRQLQELMMTNGIYVGVMGLDSMASAPAFAPTADEEVPDAAR